MNAALLLENYERIADAPGAIARLRRFVLDLAVRGKLVGQNPSDEPASKLLEQIAAEKERLVKTGELQRSRSLNPTMVEPPFELPRSWSWAAVGSIFIYDAGKKVEPKALASAAWLLELEDIEKETGRLLDRVSVQNRTAQSTKSEFRERDILYGKLRPYLNKVIVADRAGYSTTEIVAIRPYVPMCAEYCAIAFRRPDFVDYVTRLGRGTKMPRLRTEDAIVAAFPLPPLDEQHRIVAKVHELMALCNDLEAAQAERETNRDQLTAASLARFNEPDPKNPFADIRFVLDKFEPLTARADQIKPLREMILNLAVRGKLLTQDASDEPAASLLHQILRHRKAYATARRIRGDKIPSSPGVQSSLPETWASAALGQIAVVTDPNPSHRYPSYEGGTVPLLSTREFRGVSGWASEDAQLTTEEFWLFQREFCDFAPGDIIFARKGRLGLPRYLPNLAKFTFSHTLFVIKPMEGVLPAYLLMSLRREEVVQWLIQEMNQNTGVPTLGKAKMERLPIGLPPIAEQHRIVTKVDELMRLCDQLEVSLTTRAEARSQLLAAVLHRSLEPA